MIIGMEKSGKILENCNADLLITHVFVNFLAVHDTKHLKFKVQKFESHLIFRIEEYIVLKISTFKSQFCNVFFVDIKMSKMPRKVWKKK